MLKSEIKVYENSSSEHSMEYRDLFKTDDMMDCDIMEWGFNFIQRIILLLNHKEGVHSFKIEVHIPFMYDRIRGNHFSANINKSIMVGSAAVYIGEMVTDAWPASIIVPNSDEKVFYVIGSTKPNFY